MSSTAWAMSTIKLCAPARGHPSPRSTALRPMKMTTEAIGRRMKRKTSWRVLANWG